MSITHIIVVCWLAGWFISAAAYLLASAQKAREAGLPWSPQAHLATVVTLLFTWLITLVVYLYAWIKHRFRSS